MERFSPLSVSLHSKTAFDKRISEETADEMLFRFVFHSSSEQGLSRSCTQSFSSVHIGYDSELDTPSRGDCQGIYIIAPIKNEQCGR